MSKQLDPVNIILRAGENPMPDQLVKRANRIYRRAVRMKEHVTHKRRKWN